MLMKIIKMLFCKDNNESVWKDVEIVKKIFHNYIRNDENDVEAVEHIIKVDDNLISRDVMNNIEIELLNLPSLPPFSLSPLLSFLLLETRFHFVSLCWP